ncbi:curli-like amyloid fiber formation chaperone CsgH [Roseibium salinum]|uniref:Curli-like amyloid fiber formation chaperone CsgH n=1 Tax=Roseibium salinum TaxID=1604349 RepID=A0ABT3R5X4_9HYPH|nr:curli-like amyloid fiber formation chaperone CsgH [Roseibium sp. DSM 29163]MCX2724579.1 curli-like amyloid fiber formation chaperone CsgH [Roseibium sp. DSM 29163]MDN3721418.1 curli-like amyloid fiber formation chaperone CsgH [Roseibium salinum]
MLQYSKPLLAGTFALLAGTAVWAAGNGVDGEGPRCEIVESANGSMTVLQGRIEGEAGASGSYRMTVESSGGSGSTNVSQGGDFTLEKDGTATLGKVTLGNSGATYDARLKVKLDGRSFDCTGRFSDRI